MEVLHGLRVLNLAVNIPGPAAARTLSRMGADLVKVEPPAGDPMESYHSEWYRDMAAGQTIVKLDRKASEGRQHLFGLLEETDLLITGTRPAALERLELDWMTLHRKFPRLCQAAIVGYPHPRENEAGPDLAYQASLGLFAPPHMPRTLLADMAGAEQTVAASLALLLGRERGQGSGYAEVALSAAAAAMAEPLRYGLTAPGGLLGGAIPEYNLYQTSDGWIAMVAREPHFRKRMEAELGVKHLEEYRSVFRQKSAAQWEQWGRQLDIPVVAVKWA